MKSNRIKADCFSCQSRQSCEWCCLTEEELAQIDRTKITRDHSPGAVLYAQGDDCDGIYCIQAGLVGIRRLDENGNSILLRLVNPGETIGYRSLLTRRPHENSAEILMPSRICFIDRSSLRCMLARNQALGLRFLDHSLRNMKELEDSYMKGVTWNARKKLLHLLMVLDERFGSESQDGEHRIELPISRQDLAALIGTTPETMSRRIQGLQTDGLAKFEGRSVRIPDIDAICQEITLQI